MPRFDLHAEHDALPACELGADPARCAPGAMDCPVDGCDATDGVSGGVDGLGEPCPVPLAWQEVLGQFREHGTPVAARISGTSIAGRVLGTGPPLYFLNGIGGTHELFALAAWLLRDDFRCVTLDYPPGGTNSVDDLAAMVVGLADHLGDARFSIYAAGFGGAVALAAMSAAPGRIKRAVLQGGFARVRLSPFEKLAIRIARLAPGRLKHVPGRRTIQSQSHAPWFPPFDTTRWEFFSENTGIVPIAELAARGALLRGLDLSPRLAGVDRPILLVRSEGEGRVAAAAAEELQAALPAARSEFLFGCGHLPYLTHPHRLVRLIRPFLSGESDLPSP